MKSGKPAKAAGLYFFGETGIDPLSRHSEKWIDEMTTPESR